MGEFPTPFYWQGTWLSLKALVQAFDYCEQSVTIRSFWRTRYYPQAPRRMSTSASHWGDRMAPNDITGLAGKIGWTVFDDLVRLVIGGAGDYFLPWESYQERLEQKLSHSSSSSLLGHYPISFSSWHAEAFQSNLPRPCTHNYASHR